MEGAAAEGRSSAVAAAGRDLPSLVRMAAAALCRDGGGVLPSSYLAQLPPELVKVVWKEVRALLKRQERVVACKHMSPFVRGCWRVENLDLSDGGRWVTDGALAALSFVPSLKHVRLTACKFVSDGGLDFCTQVPIESLDVSWTGVTDAGLNASVARCPSLTSLNLTGLRGLSDAGVSALLPLYNLERLSLASTAISDAALDYLTYYSRFPDAGPPTMGCHRLKRLEISNTKVSDTGVGKLVAVIEDGTPYGKVFKELEYLALSSTPQASPSCVRQVRTKYGFDAPLPNAQRTLAKSNAVALDAQQWVLRLCPDEKKGLPAVKRAWEEERVLAYVAQYTKEMAASEDVIRRLTAADHGGPPMNLHPASGDGAKRQRVA